MTSTFQNDDKLKERQKHFSYRLASLMDFFSKHNTSEGFWIDPRHINREQQEQIEKNILNVKIGSKIAGNSGSDRHRHRQLQKMLIMVERRTMCNKEF